MDAISLAQSMAQYAVLATRADHPTSDDERQEMHSAASTIAQQVYASTGRDFWLGRASAHARLAGTLVRQRLPRQEGTTFDTQGDTD